MSTLSTLFFALCGLDNGVHLTPPAALNQVHWALPLTKLLVPQARIAQLPPKQ
jgi:hypothetical protein